MFCGLPEIGHVVHLLLILILCHCGDRGAVEVTCASLRAARWLLRRPKKLWELIHRMVPLLWMGQRNPTESPVENGGTWWLIPRIVSGLVHPNYKWINPTKIPSKSLGL